MGKKYIARCQQLHFGRDFGIGSKNAGRKKSKGSGASHLKREDISASTPVHVTKHLVDGLPDLRSFECYGVLFDAFNAGCTRAGSRVDAVFRITDYSVQGNHLHLIVEAEDADALSRGLNGLFVRMARGLNRLWGRRGKVFGERYHAHVLRTPRQVFHAIRYVLRNAVKHGRAIWPGNPDPFSSGECFEGWEDPDVDVWTPVRGPVVPGRSWLRRIGWRRYGLIPIWAG